MDNTEIEKSPYGNLTVWNKQFTLTFAANVLLCFSQHTVNTLISTYASYLGAGAVTIGMVSGLYFGVSAAARPFSGPIISKLDQRKIMIWIYALGVLTGLVYAFSGDIAMFITARVMHGIEFAFVGSLNLTLASNSLPREKLGTGIGIFGLGAAVATAIGPSMGIAIFGWAQELWGSDTGYMVVFLVSAGFMLLGLIPVFLLDPCKPGKKALEQLGAWYKNIISVKTLIPAGLMLLVSASSILFSTYMVPYADSKGIENIGLFFTVYAVVLLVSRPLCGKLIDKIGVGRLYCPGAIVYLLSFLIVALGNSLPAMLVAAVFAAVGFGTLNPAIITLCMRSVPHAKRGVASNTQYFGIDIGFFLGPVMGGFVNAYLGYSSMYIIGAVPVVLSGVLFMATWRSLKNRLY